MTVGDGKTRCTLADRKHTIDQVGSDRVVLGSDWPFVQWDPSPGGWGRGLQSLTDEEKDNILWKNVEVLLGL